MLRTCGKPGALVVLLAGLAGTAAQAEVVSSPARAVEMLVQARVMAERCGWLDDAARGDLSAFAAQAELAAVRREGAQAARRAVRKGRAAGRKAVCDSEGREMVLAVLEGAREAMRVAGMKPAGHAATRKAAAERRAEPASSGEKQAKSPQTRRVAASAPLRKPRPAPRNERLARYQRMAASYYHELKCRRLPHGALMRMWRKVRDEHMALLRQGAGQALAAAKKAAARKGRQRSC